jgi:hypothetical protein
MKNLLASLIVSFSIAAASNGTEAHGQQFAAEATASSLPGNGSGSLSRIPAVPKGKSTLFGGEIRKIDPVRDELTLGVFGQGPLRMLFDERTQVYRDGKQISLRELTEKEHASVETTLDGTKLFAVSIHILSHLPDGEFEGRVIGYDPGSGELTVMSSRSAESLKLLVRKDTSIVRKGQSTFASAASGLSDLTNGGLVSVHFAAGGNRAAIAREIDVLAVPGAAFVFSGDIASIDLHSGILVLRDPRDEQNHQVVFDPMRVSAVESAHVGDSVRVIANYDGTNYVATEISATKP